MSTLPTKPHEQDGMSVNQVKAAISALAQGKVLEPWPNSYLRKQLLQSQLVEVVRKRIGGQR
jgi:hypothetical protein